MSDTQSTSMMLASLVSATKKGDFKSSTMVVEEPSESFDIPRLQPSVEPQRVAQPKFDIDYGQVLTNSLAASASKRYSPTEK